MAFARWEKFQAPAERPQRSGPRCCSSTCSRHLRRHSLDRAHRGMRRRSLWWWWWFKIVASSVFFRSFQNRQACILIVFRESCSLAQRSNSFQDRHLPVFFEHFKIVRPSAFFLGGSAAGPKWAREFISKIDRPRSFSHRGSRKRVPRGSIRFSSGAAPGGWLPSRGTPTPGRLAHRGRLAWSPRVRPRTALRSPAFVLGAVQVLLCAAQQIISKSSPPCSVLICRIR